MLRTCLRTCLASSTAIFLIACSDGTQDDPVVNLDLADLDQSMLADEPVMFSVTDDDSEIILYGTFHILPPETRWQTEALSAAIERADEVWFELPAGADTDPALQQLTMQLGMSPTPLSERLDAETYARLQTEAGKLGLPMANIDPMQPWLASITLPIVQMMSEGFDPSAGVEAVLEPRVEGKPRQAFETAEQQLRFFADMDMDAQIEMLGMTLDSMDEGADLLNRMAVSWAGGDVDMLEDEVVLETKREAPEMYDVMFTRRNAAWAERLDAEMQGSGVDFVAVGAGHLLGPDSVPVMMADKGYEVRVLTLRED